MRAHTLFALFWRCMYLFDWGLHYLYTRSRTLTPIKIHIKSSKHLRVISESEKRSALCLYISDLFFHQTAVNLCGSCITHWFHKQALRAAPTGGNTWGVWEPHRGMGINNSIGNGQNWSWGNWLSFEKVNELDSDKWLKIITICNQ